MPSGSNEPRDQTTLSPDELYALRRIELDGFMSVVRPVECDLYSLAAKGLIRNHIMVPQPERLVTLTALGKRALQEAGRSRG